MTIRGFVFGAALATGLTLASAAIAQIAPPTMQLPTLSKPKAAAPAPASQDLIPPMEAEAPVELQPLEGETHPVLNLMPDKSELVRLDREASSVIVGAPSQVSVVLDTPRLAVVIPRSPGATYMSVLDKEGNVIMQRHVVVAAPKKNYVRIRRSCNSNAATTGRGGACQPTSVYFCPDMCHEVGQGGSGQNDR